MMGSVGDGDGLGLGLGFGTEDEATYLPVTPPQEKESASAEMI